MLNIDSSADQSSSKKSRAVFIAFLLVLTLCYRLFASQMDWLGNTSPLMAIAFGGGMILGRRFWWLPALLLVGSDVGLALFNGWGLGSHLIYTLPFYVLVCFAGARMAKNQHWLVMLGGTLLASSVFYLLANTVAWASSPSYAHDFVGWLQSQTSGLPGYPPAWTFLRNALLADLIWCLMASPLFFSKTLILQNQSKLFIKRERMLFS
ncbi:MAG: hypothetical protein L3J39_06390 [Verrucomicrobiales bacterium]|nr:hypothetical protein [Verrucomicrobiales bacterium]